MNGQTDRQTDGQTETDRLVMESDSIVSASLSTRQTVGWTDRQTHRQRQTDR